MSDEPAGKAGATDEAAAARRVALSALLAAQGTRCPHCRYSLAGLSDTQPGDPYSSKGGVVDRCPECGGGLQAGLVGGVGSSRMKRLMVLMFAWLAFAGCMNATRRGLAICDVVRLTGAVNTGWTFYTPYSVTTTPGGTASPAASIWSLVPSVWWTELSGWSALGIVGLGGAIAAGTLRADGVRREKRLVVLLVLGFVAYWGYHGFQFLLEMIDRV